jgi:hypothetical protein
LNEIFRRSALEFTPLFIKEIHWFLIREKALIKASFSRDNFTLPLVAIIGKNGQNAQLSRLDPNL